MNGKFVFLWRIFSNDIYITKTVGLTLKAVQLWKSSKHGMHDHMCFILSR